MNQTDENQIAVRSYFIWEKEGKPEGKALEHWLRAQGDLETELASQTKSGKPKRTRATTPKKSKVAAKTKKPKTVKVV